MAAWLGFVSSALGRAAPPDPSVAWRPARPRVGDVGWVSVGHLPRGAELEGTVGGRSLAFFPWGDGQAALVGFDLETRAGATPWRVVVRSPGRAPRTLSGRLRLEPRSFPIQRLTLPSTMVDLDPETERRATAEAARLRDASRMVTPERLWRGGFLPPVVTEDPPTGFGARRILNGQPRAPHTGIDFGVPAGTPVLAANAGRVALTGDHYFPGRLVVLDHGRGLHTLYFHLERAAVVEGDRVGRGQVIGTVGSTGRATGPHLHFAVLVGAARVDPSTLLTLEVSEPASPP